MSDQQQAGAYWRKLKLRTLYADYRVLLANHSPGSEEALKLIAERDQTIVAIWAESQAALTRVAEQL
jgi:hypothetical protein